MKVLIIEDNPRLSERIKNHLHKNYLVEVAHSGDEAITIAATKTTDIILLDLNLPDMQGLKYVKKSEN